MQAFDDTAEFSLESSLSFSSSLSGVKLQIICNTITNNYNYNLNNYNQNNYNQNNYNQNNYNSNSCTTGQILIICKTITNNYNYNQNNYNLNNYNQNNYNQNNYNQNNYKRNNYNLNNYNQNNYNNNSGTAGQILIIYAALQQAEQNALSYTAVTSMSVCLCVCVPQNRTHLVIQQSVPCLSVCMCVCVPPSGGRPESVWDLPLSVWHWGFLHKFLMNI